MAIAGPITSLALGFGSFYLAGALARPIEADPEKPMELLSSLGPVAALRKPVILPSLTTAFRSFTQAPSMFLRCLLAPSRAW